MKPRFLTGLLALILLSSAAFVSAQTADEARLLRFPDINGDLAVFVYAGDIWSVPASGGEARRLTSDLGLELFPKISPDGRWIAFSAEYSGTRQIYVMPSTGGVPRQLTFYNDIGLLPPRGGFDHQVLDWTPDGRRILFKANRVPYSDRAGKYFLVNLEGGLEKPLQIPEGSSATFSPDGKSLAYTPFMREFRTWKRHRGGRAQDVWVYDLEKDQARQITDFTGTDQHPIWHKDRVYFVSDRDLTLNVHAYDLKTGTTKPITRFSDYDVLWPSGKAGVIAFEKGGYLWALDLASEQVRKIPVRVHFDNPNVLARFQSVKDNIANFDLSPTGKRAAFEARGEIFTVPEKEGLTYNLTRSQGPREIYPRYSPDGKSIAYYSDETGEYEIYLKEVGGGAGSKAVPLTSDSSRWRFAPVWSPDSTKLLFSDKNQNFQFLDIKTKAVTPVDKPVISDITDYAWSPDSKWITYTKEADNGQSGIWVYSLEQGKAQALTDGRFNDFSPVFSRDGKYLFFLSNRTFNLDFSGFEFSYVYNKPARIYALALTPSAPVLFPEKNDAEEVKSEAAAAPAQKGTKPAEPKASAAPEAKKPAAVQVDFAAVDSRIVVFPPEADNYQALLAVEGGVVYVKAGELHKFTFEDKKDIAVIKGITNGALSADGKKLLYQAQDSFGIIDLAPNQKPGDGALNLSGLEVKVEPLKEWDQIYQDGWRIYRDWFYMPNMHAVDWQKMKDKYEALVPYVSHRADLDYIFGELVGELNVGHAYVDWGTFTRPKRVEGGLLGAEFKADDKSGRYLISKIYKGENWDESSRSPLTEQGVEVKEGDYLIRLNGQDVTTRNNPYRLLENTAGKKTSVVVNARPSAEGAREYWVRPVKSEQRLIYLDWVASRRAMADKLSGGRVGYIHVPDTAVAGNRELFKGFYAYAHKDALIIDERYNGGGFIPNLMADLLGRRPLNYIAGRNPRMTATPGYVHQGPMVMLINHSAGSGGDAFPYYFKKMKLGLTIGTRTWGGLVGLSGNPGFVDGSSVSVPTFGFVGTDGEFAGEGLGVSPDIEVIDRPDLVAKGQDPALEKGVEVLLEELRKNPPQRPAKPQAPDRSKWHEKIK
ncbi:MAG: acetyl-CoA synthetase [Candidatus Aminicenantes bacterium RBG_13_63_10]|nr:MAG: acetyl-CoA synthetase [Candidatus Aminicenantes bacterium RBG_13_63_10]